MAAMAATVLVIDTSLSMASVSTDGKSSQLNDAVKHIRDFAAGVLAQQATQLLGVLDASQEKLVCPLTRDSSQIMDALSRLRVRTTVAWPSVFSMLSRMAEARGSGDATRPSSAASLVAVVVSDDDTVAVSMLPTRLDIQLHAVCVGSDRVVSHAVLSDTWHAVARRFAPGSSVGVAQEPRALLTSLQERLYANPLRALVLGHLQASVLLHPGVPRTADSGFLDCIAVLGVLPAQHLAALPGSSSHVVVAIEPSVPPSELWQRDPDSPLLPQILANALAGSKHGAVALLTTDSSRFGVLLGLPQRETGAVLLTLQILAPGVTLPWLGPLDCLLPANISLGQTVPVEDGRVPSYATGRNVIRMPPFHPSSLQTDLDRLVRYAGKYETKKPSLMAECRKWQRIGEAYAWPGARRIVDDVLQQHGLSWEQVMTSDDEGASEDR